MPTFQSEWTQTQPADNEIRKDCKSKIRNIDRKERVSKPWSASERITDLFRESKGLKQKK